ncbi:MAG TPA: hypothetical protein VN922_01645, partial [Bacteroidia bacterium]|nr:hypothetical protein [Bacteroidia bacterium]
MSLVLNNITPTANAATVAALPSYTYSNGTNNDGVGATLTGSSNGALAAIDGWTPVLYGLVLVMNEPSTSNKYYNNGLYVVTQVGDASHPYILTRHITMQTSDQFTPGIFVPVGAGGVQNINSLWMFQYSTGTFTVGSSVVSFSNIGSLGTNFTVQSLSDGSPITWNVALGQNATVTLGTAGITGNTRALTIQNPTPGKTYTIKVIQPGHATASQALTFTATTKVSGNGYGTAGTVVLSQSTSTYDNAIDILSLYYDGTNYYCS